MIELNSGQRKQLRAMAHHLEPLILVGNNGVSDSLVRATSEALEAHELIKVRFNEFKEEKKELLEEIANRTGSLVVGMIGHVGILYKWQSDDEKRKVELNG